MNRYGHVVFFKNDMLFDNIFLSQCPDIGDWASVKAKYLRLSQNRRYRARPHGRNHIVFEENDMTVEGLLPGPVHIARKIHELTYINLGERAYTLFVFIGKIVLDLHAIKEDDMSETRDAYVKKIQAKLAEWNAEIDKLEAKIDQADAEGRAALQKQIEMLRAKRGETEEKLEQVKQAGGEAWKDVKVGLEVSARAMGEAVKSAVSRFL